MYVAALLLAGLLQNTSTVALHLLLTAKHLREVTSAPCAAAAAHTCPTSAQAVCASTCRAFHAVRTLPFRPQAHLSPMMRQSLSSCRKPSRCSPRQELPIFMLLYTLYTRATGPSTLLLLLALSLLLLSLLLPAAAADPGPAAAAAVPGDALEPAAMAFQGVSCVARHFLIRSSTSLAWSCVASAQHIKVVSLRCRCTRAW